MDYDRCASSGTCAGVAPEVFEIGPDGLLRVLQEEPPDELAAAVAEAEELCPTAAITVER